ncbi:MAG TPA: fused MFS/spermidine synthase, partial [Burkholderiales bacterium]|nr:fused MFS/spermidine synthase [Burkholderiales bacterium]
PHLSLFPWMGFQGFVSIVFLLLPATAMGASFPMVLKAAEDKSLGTLYGLNTAGAAFGALLPLGLLPEVGWTWSVRLVASIGLMVGISGLLLSRGLVSEAREEKPFPKQWTLLAYAGIGASSLMLQVGWTRLYSLVLFRTEYVLAVILAVYLAGMGIGSLISRKRQIWLFVLPACASLFTVGSLWLFPHYSAWVESARFASLSGALFTEGGMLALMTLPVTLALGAWLPLLSERYEAKGAWLYGINSLGAAFGALIGGLVFIPLFGTTATVAISGMGFLVFGLSWVRSRLAWVSVPLLLIFAYPVWHFPEVNKLLPREEAGSRDLYRFEDALAVTHVVEERNGQRLLLTDLQRMDASTDPTAVFVQKNQARLPLLLHPNAHSILFLGLGTGISAAGSLPYEGLDRTAVELSEGAIHAAGTWFALSNQNIMKDMKVYRDDARHFLIASNRRYDVIVGDLFHPDLTGVGALLSRQEFQHARNHLTENGIFVQWLALNQFDLESMEAVLRGFREVFPNAVLFVDGMHLALVGPNGRFADAEEMQASLSRLGDIGSKDATGGEGLWTWLGRYWGPIDAGRGPIQGEWSPHIEFSLPRARYDGEMDLPKIVEALLRKRPSVGDAERVFGVGATEQGSFEGAYIGAELAARSWMAFLAGEDMEALKLRRYAYEANPKDRWIASTLADNMMQSLPEAIEHGMDRKAALKRVLEVYPYDVEALRQMMRLENAAGNREGMEVYRSRLLAVSPLDREVRP